MANIQRKCIPLGLFAFPEIIPGRKKIFSPSLKTLGELKRAHFTLSETSLKSLEANEISARVDSVIPQFN